MRFWKSSTPISRACQAGRESITDDWLKRFENGDRTACARLITWIENDVPQVPDILSAIYPRVGNAQRIGITGPPGAGKSTLTEKITHSLRKMGRTVGVIAVDPTSPFTGGAILGDRVRMSSLFTDPGVFIRSMATRGSLGGLASKTKQVCDVMDAFGKDVILIETVGVGQAELDVASAAHTTLVVLVPEGGDGIQAMKAGLMEIGDLFAVNKSDREGADRMVVEIEMMLSMRPESEKWFPAVIQTMAREGKGVNGLVEHIVSHYDFLKKNQLLESFRKENIRSEIKQIIENHLYRAIWIHSEINEKLEKLVTDTLSGKTSPGEAAKTLLLKWGKINKMIGNR